MPEEGSDREHRLKGFVEQTVSTGAPGESPAAAVERHVGSTVSRLQTALLDRTHYDHARTVSTLARLRRVAVDDVGNPAVWEVLFAGAPQHLMGTSDQPSRAERAMHAALVLYAIHAQSADGARHVRGRSLGHAVGDLARRSDGDEYANGSVAKRFKAFVTATTWPIQVGHLRGLVSLLRSEGIGFDYGALATDLYWSQTPDGLRRRRLGWGRDFHHIPNESRTSPTSTASVVTVKEN